MFFGAPFETTGANIIFVILSAIPTNWFASLFYPTDRPEPTPLQAVRFSRRSDIFRAAMLFTYDWLQGTPFDFQFFLTDFSLNYIIGSVIGERVVGTKQRRSEFGVHLLWTLGIGILSYLSPSFLSYFMAVAERLVWRATYIALIDDLMGVLTRPDLKTWKGKVRLVLVQAFVIFISCFVLLRWRRAMIVAYEQDEEWQATLAARKVSQEPVDVEGEVEDDGDRFLV